MSGDELAGHRPALRAAARGLTNDLAECEDLVQETYVRALSYVAARHEPVRNPRAWMVAILRNLFVDRIRAERPTARTVEELPEPEPEPQPPWANVTVADIRAACAHINPDLRIVFELRYLEGLRYHEIADRMAIPENTVASRLYRARGAIRDHLLASTSEETRRE